MSRLRAEGLWLGAALAAASGSVPGASAFASPKQTQACSCANRTLAMTLEGLTICRSSLGPKETMDRLAAAAADHGMTILARIDHAAAAAAVGLQLRPTEVLVFGNPRGGTPLMEAAQTIGIDLPLKALVWQDEEGRTWLAYNDPNWLAKRHGAENGTGRPVAAMTEVLAALAKRATTETTGSTR